MMAEAARAVAAATSPASPSAGAMRTLRRGEQLGGRYQIQRFIARGGMGEVYEALDTTLHELVALKTLSVTAVDCGEAGEALLHEVRMARRVSHGNVCRILELGIHHRVPSDGEPIPFLTMELLSGETLARRLRMKGALEPTEVFRLARDCCAGLHAIHMAGIVHRDFKSENVYLAQSDRPPARTVVMDFGLARVLERPSAGTWADARLVVGTPAYMAPEQLAGLPATPASDIYALGVVIFEMLTGRLPFSGHDVKPTAVSRMHGPGRVPSAVTDGLNPQWDDLVRRCLARDPRARFPDAQTVMAAMDDIVLERRRRRLPALAVVGVAIAMSAVAASLMFCQGKSMRNSSTAGPQQGTNTVSSKAASSQVNGPLPNSDVILPAVAQETPSPSQPTPRAKRRPPSKGDGPVLRLPPLSAPDEPAAPLSFDSLSPPPVIRPHHPDDLVDPF